MLFVAYDSARRTVTAVADELRAALPQFYPAIRCDLAEVAGVRLPRGSTCNYEELVLVGHSLGGLIVRRALCDEAEVWHRSGGARTRLSPLLQARTRLFSPASAGFRPSGFRALLLETKALFLIRMILARSPAYIDLLSDSPILTNTKDRTEQLVTTYGPRLRALVPCILWADPDNVVRDERYNTDFHVWHQRPSTHSSVCKPTARYSRPRRFVEGCEK